MRSDRLEQIRLPSHPKFRWQRFRKVLSRIGDPGLRTRVRNSVNTSCWGAALTYGEICATGLP